jgi:hypothetical protein
MAKFKPARGRKPKAPLVPAAGLPCVILLISGVLLAIFFVYFVLKNANG